MKLPMGGIAATIALLALGAGSQAAEIKVLSSNALKTALEELGPQFEKTTEHRIVFVFNAAAEVVAKGEAEIGLTQIAEILPFPGAELAGPLPAEIQLYTVFAAGVGADAKEAEAAKAFLKFLTAPAAAPVIAAKGLEPS